MTTHQTPFLEGNHTDVTTDNKTLRDLLTLALNDENKRNNVCASFEKKELLFKDLADNASRVAVSLLSYDVVAVCMQPSLELIVTLCGIALRGIPYIPLEPTLPIERIEYILNDSQAQLLIIDDSSVNVKTPVTITYARLCTNSGDFNGQEMKQINGEDSFCLMYTSGSTGQPKGVRLPHRALLNRLHWQWSHFPFTGDEKCCFKTSISFVDSIAEIFAPLLRHVPITILRKSLLLDINRFIDVMLEERISRIVLVPSLLTVLLDYLKNSKKRLNSLKFIVCSGENLSISLIELFFALKDNFASNCLLLNLYGSTEVMADVTYEVFESAEYLSDRYISDGRTSIGSPIDNMRVDIVEPDERGIGELVVKGKGVANGYHNVDATNSALFNKFTRVNDGTLRFRTGDIGRIWNGRIILYGRNDTQIKIGGNRVDLVEIEFTLKRYCRCRQPVAVYSAVNNQIVVILREDEEPSSLDRESLSKHLPSYAIPARVIRISHFPLLVSGKLDRQKLIKLADAHKISLPLESEVNGESNDSHAFYSALADIGIARADADQSFFGAGGSSLNALILIAKLHRIGFQDINIERLMYTTSLKDILNQQLIRKQHRIYDPFHQCDYRYSVISLERVDRFEAQRILTESFVELNEIDALVHKNQSELKRQCKFEWFSLLDAIWPYYVAADLSFGVSTHDGQLIGIALSKDLADQMDIDMPKMNLLSPLFDMFEAGRNKLTQDLRSRELLPESILQGFLTAVNPDVEPQKRIAIMYFLEHQVLQVAAAKQFQAVLTVNASPVTQQLAEQIFKYDYNQAIHINQYRDFNGALIFPHAQDHHTATVSMKLLHDL